MGRVMVVMKVIHLLAGVDLDSSGGNLDSNEIIPYDNIGNPYRMSGLFSEKQTRHSVVCCRIAQNCDLIKLILSLVKNALQGWG